MTDKQIRNPLMYYAFVMSASALLSACAPIPLDRDSAGAVEPARPAASRTAPADSDEQTDSGPVSWQDGNESWTYKDPDNAPKIAPQNWVFEEAAIKINVSAEDVLNQYDGRIHTTVIQVFQLKDQRAFQDMTKTDAGVQYLLASKAEALGTDIVDNRELIVTPGGTASLTLDRLDGTRYVGIIAGYYDVQKGRASRLIGFPAIDDTPPIRYGLFDALTFGLFADEPEQIPPRPARLLINLTLGEQAIKSADIKAL